MEQLNKSNSRKPKRKLRRSFLIVFCAVALLLIGVFTIPGFIRDNKLKDLGYSNEAVTSINKLNLSDDFIENEIFSDLLNEEIVKTDFRQDDLTMYTNRSSNTDEDWFLYDRLQTIDYSKDDAVKILNELEFFEITPMFVFNNINDLDAYIEDCRNNRAANSLDYFVLDNDYYSHYEDTVKIADANAVDKLLNKTYYLEADYVPELQNLSLKYATRDISVSKLIAEDLQRMCDDIRLEGMNAYVVSGYRSYQYQEQLFNRYTVRDGLEKALTYSARPGFSEHQSGQAVDLASGTTSGLGGFVDSPEYLWLLENAHKYGFILRYPENKTTITGYTYESWHWRYLGVDLATKVKESKLTYDEYYMLYLAE